jgi:hypothetical protein
MGLAVLRDIDMSNAHFELAWDGAVCRLRDLKSSTGTLLGGERVEEALVQHGDWIRAGSTDFSFYLEGSAAPTLRDEPEPPSVRERKLKVLSVLEKQENLFAVLDAAQGERVLALLQQSTEEYQSLYEGRQGEILENVAPYLVRLRRGSPLLATLVDEGWGNHWGIYLTCELSFLETRRHLRKFLMVQAEGWDARLYFRYYDPRVLGVFLGTCPPQQKTEFFGPIARVFYNTEDALVSVSPGDTTTGTDSKS